MHLYLIAYHEGSWLSQDGLYCLGNEQAGARKDADDEGMRLILKVD